MIKHRMISIIFLILLSFGANVFAGELIIPKDGWEPIFFKLINKVSSEAGLQSLRSYFLERDDLEIRFWDGFGQPNLRGFVLKRSGGVWSGSFVIEAPSRDEGHIRSVSPKQGWDYLWRELDAYGIMTLPDSSQLKGEVIMQDGTCYVVELNYHGQYRTYQYGNPKYQPWPEAIQIQKIAQLLNKELLEQGN
jgi:hypothetical protein